MELKTIKNNKIKPLIVTFLLLVSTLLSFSSKTAWYADKSEWTPLMKATFKGNYNKMVKLIERGKYNFEKRTKIDATEIAIRKQDPIALHILLNTGKISYSNSGDLIMVASGYKNLAIIKLLVDFGFPVTNGINSYSPLMSASSYGSTETVDYLINNGSKINQHNKSNGMTPLMYAVLNGKLSIVKLLLERGANKNAVNKNGKKAIYYINVIRDDVVSNSVKTELLMLLR